MLQQVPGGDDHPVRALRQRTDVRLNTYKQDVKKLNSELKYVY